MKRELKRVVITGLGVVCPLGNGVGEAYRRLKLNESGIKTIE